MAGGKETPRQKMIGMMYLVLTALLALNVSKQILDAFVAIEENIQRSSETQLDVAFEAEGKIRQALTEAEIEVSNMKDPSQGEPLLKERKSYVKMAEDINKKAGEIIKMIDEAKLEILGKAGEMVASAKDGDKEAILWKEYDPKNPCRPAKLNLMAVSAKDNFDVPMHELIGTDIKTIDEGMLGMPIWKKYKEFRSGLMDIVGNYENSSGDKFTMKAKGIDDFKDNKDLKTKITSMLKASGNKQQEKEISALTDIYGSLTKKELADHHDQEGIHWLGRTFDHAPMVGALASLSTLQFEVLSARAKALALVANRCGAAKYNFDMIAGIATVNTGVVEPGGSFQLRVSAGAYNSAAEPEVFFENESLKNNSKLDSVYKGVAYYTVKATGGGEMPISGNIKVKGSSEDIPFETKISIAKGEGAVEMPEFNILYVGYSNFMVPSGCLEPRISASGCSVSATTKKGRRGFSVRPGSKGPVTVRITGKDAQGGAVSFGPFPYTAKAFPSAVFKTKKINKATGGVVEAKMPDSSPINANITVVRGLVLGIDNGGFSGKRIPADKLKSFRKGNKIGVTLTVKNQLTGLLQDIDGSLTLK